jgi:S1-C subfamily serine protease
MATRTPGGGVEITVGQQAHSFSMDRITIGRDPGSDVVIENPHVSRQHAVLTREDGTWVLESVSPDGLHYEGRLRSKIVLTGPTEVWLSAPPTGERIHVSPERLGGDVTRVAPGAEISSPTVVSPGAGSGDAAAAPGGPLQGVSGIRVRTGGRELMFAAGRTVTIGRLDTSDVRIDDPSISREHATLRFENGTWVLESVGRLGTFRDGSPVTTVSISGSTTLRLGDAAGVELELIPDTGAAVTRPVARPPVATPVVPAPGVPQAPQQIPGGAFATGATGKSSVVRRLATANRRTQTIAVVAVVLAVVLGGVAVFFAFTNGGSTSAASVVAAAKPKTVFVGQPAGSGSGWVYNADQGLIVTNAHVTAGTQNLQVGITGVGIRPATLLGEAPCEDLAVIQVADHTGLESFTLGSRSDLAEGDTVVTLGYPGSFSNTTRLTNSSGQVAVLQTDWPAGGYADLIQHTATINHGNSGGPLVDLAGDLVGVNTLTNNLDVQTQNQYYAISSDRVKQVVPTLTQGISIARDGIGPLGLGAEPLHLTVDGSQRTLLRISSVLPNSPAAAQGITGARQVRQNLELGFALLNVAGKPITTTLDYCNVIRAEHTGDTVDYRVVKYLLNTQTGVYVDAKPKTITIRYS